MSMVGLESRIPHDYRHVAKLARPAPGITVAGSALKWYDVARATAPVPDEIRALAQEGLAEAARTGGLALADVAADALARAACGIAIEPKRCFLLVHDQLGIREHGMA